MKSKRVKTLAEKEAIKRYPEVKSKNVGNRFTDLAGAMFENVKVGFSRRGFVEGAEWQKKQDELTWKDLQKLDIIANEVWQDGKYDKNNAQEFYTKVLDEFNNIQEQKNKYQNNGL